MSEIRWKRLGDLGHLLLSLWPLLGVLLFYLYCWRGKVELGHWPVAFGDGPRYGNPHDSPNYMPETDALYVWLGPPAAFGLLYAPLGVLIWLVCIPFWWKMSRRRRWLHGGLMVMGIAACLTVVLIDPGHRLKWFLD